MKSDKVELNQGEIYPLRLYPKSSVRRHEYIGETSEKHVFSHGEGEYRVFVLIDRSLIVKDGEVITQRQSARGQPRVVNDGSDLEFVLDVETLGLIRGENTKNGN